MADAADAADPAALAAAVAVIFSSSCLRLSLSISFRSARCARSVCAAISLSLRRLTGTRAAAQVDRPAVAAGGADTAATGAELGPDAPLPACCARNARIESAVGEKSDEAECTSTRAEAEPLPLPEPRPLTLTPLPPPGLDAGGSRLVCAPFEAAPACTPPAGLAVRPPPAASMAALGDHCASQPSPQPASALSLLPCCR